MNNIRPEQLIHQLNWRYATKQFDSQRKISPETWATLEDALVLSPSSYGLQPWKFVVVTDPIVKEQLSAVSWCHRQPADCSHLVVFAVKKDLGQREIDHFIARIAHVRNVSVESLSDYRDMMTGSIIHCLDNAERSAWAARQVYIALGNFLNSAALLGIDACLMEDIEPTKYNEFLGLDKLGLRAVAAAAAGYRAATDKSAALKKVRFPKDEVLLKI
ncbi:MAG TPA: NAD(P)H-dependent oxidoreductase [Verrucomicrobiae bacterium]|nr:NAD(P)H-dependent oxidoreductase [Verrucomicrobiae bacterium]